MAILINPTVKLDFKKLQSLAQKNRIKIYFAKNKCGGDWDAIRMGFGGLLEYKIEDAVKIFSKIWFESIIDSSYNTI